MSDHEIEVVFRKYPEDGQIVAVFPYIIGNADQRTITTYAFGEGHGQAHYNRVIWSTSLATKEESEPLRKHLELAVGYRVKRIVRINWKKWSTAMVLVRDDD